jgi:hypothetical protein
VVEVWANGGLVAAGDVVKGAVGWLFGFCYGAHFWKGGVFGMCGNVRGEDRVYTFSENASILVSK